jgi:NAD(P)-dependent dehydrogenase (short-subunit alcohol dehydrogenase family)
VRAIGVAADVSAASGVEEVLALTREAFDGADILINNAGTGSNETIQDAPDDKWQYYWDLHTMAAVRLCRGLIPGMKQRGRRRDRQQRLRSAPSSRSATSRSTT